MDVCKTLFFVHSCHCITCVTSIAGFKILDTFVSYTYHVLLVYTTLWQLQLLIKFLHTFGIWFILTFGNLLLYTPCRFTAEMDAPLPSHDCLHIPFFVYLPIIIVRERGDRDRE